MKYLYFLFIALFAITYSNAQIVDIPDANFKYTLVNENVVDTDGNFIPDADADTNDDGEIQVSEAEAVLSLHINDKNISLLEGIQSFTNLEILLCFDNQISSLDISQNSNLLYLHCANNLLSSVDVSQNLNLLTLNCRSNYLTSLDVTQNYNLSEINCGNNPLTSLDVTQNPNLGALHCYSNQLSSIDVTQNQNLNFLNCGSNQLTSLDVTQNPSLRELICYYNQLSSLDVSQNPLLFILYSLDNQLTNLNIKNGNNTILEIFVTYNNPNLYCIQVDDIEYANNSNWQKDDWAEYSEECELGLEDNNVISFTIYPNPVQDVLFLDSPQQIESVKIYSLHGKLVKEDISSSVDVSQLITGLYFAQVTVNGKTGIYKFIKQ